MIQQAQEEAIAAMNATLTDRAARRTSRHTARRGGRRVREHVAQPGSRGGGHGTLRTTESGSQADANIMATHWADGEPISRIEEENQDENPSHEAEVCLHDTTS